MTKEQEEAIEICKKKIIEPFYDFPNPTSIELKDTDVEAIETVLSMLKEKDKQIDLMAEWIEKHTKYYDEDGCYCELEKKICEKDIECKYCIKQYFENKVKE